MLLTLALLLSSTGSVAAQGTGAHRAGVVIVSDTGQAATTACVRFAEDALPGLELLRRANAPLVTQASVAGEAVCKLDATGCDYPAQNCFCQCMSAQCVYWSYWYLEEGAWVYSGKGGGHRLVRDGGVDAWVWGDGNTPPPAVTLDSLCSSAGIAALAASALTVLETTQQPTPASASAQQQSYPDPGPTDEPTNGDEYPAPMEEDTPAPEPTEEEPPEQGAEPTTLAIPTRAGATGTPRPSRTPAPTRTPRVTTAAGSSPTQALPTSPFEMVQPTGGAKVSITPEAQATPSGPATSASSAATPDTVAARIRAAVARLRATPAATAQAEHKPGGLWAFALLVVLLAAAGGYVLLLRRQRAQALRHAMMPEPPKSKDEPPQE